MLDMHKLHATFLLQHTSHQHDAEVSYYVDMPQLCM